MSILNNKNALILAFDEVIGRNTDFEGNFDSIFETRIIMEHLKNNNNNQQLKESFNSLYKIVNETIEFTESSLITTDNTYFLTGWSGHSIFIFYEKNDDNTYTFGFINAGEGSELQGYKDNLVNGIVLFKKVSFDIIEEFFGQYKLFLINSFTSERVSYSYVGFYAIIYNVFNTENFNGILTNNDRIDIDRAYISNMSFIKIRPQIIGSCFFTNHINYLSYLLYKKDSKYYLDFFDEWYLNSKKYMCKILYDEMKNNEVEYFNELNYIDDLYNINKRSNNITFFKIPKINTEYKIYEESTNNLYFSKETLRNIIIKVYEAENIGLSENDINIIINFFIIKQMNDKSFSLYLYKPELFIKVIYEYHKFNLSFNVLFDLYIIKMFIINSLYYKDQLINFFYSIFNNLNVDKELIFNKLSYDNYSRDMGFILLYTVMFNTQSAFIIENKEQNHYNIFYDINNSKKKNDNIKAYNKMFVNLPITNGNYINVISSIIKEINDNINYYPDITEKKFDSNLNTNSNKGYLRISSNLMLDFNINYFPSLYSYNNDNNYINNYDNILSLFLQSDNFLSDININNFIFETFRIIDKNTNINTSNIMLEDSTIQNTGIYESYETKIKLLKPRIEIKLNEKNKFYVSHYIIYFYICELENKKIEQKYIDKYNNNNDFIEKLQDLTSNKYFFILIQEYCLKYNKSVLINKIQEKIDRVEYIIPKTEKKFFNEKKYIVSKCNNNNEKISYYEAKGIINFYIINYTCSINKNTDTSIFSKKLLIYRHNNSTDKSILIIKKLLEIYKYNILYIAINFTFEHKIDNVFIGTDKNDNSNQIYWCQEHNLFFYMNTKYFDKSFKIINNTELKNTNYENFYNIMMLNDPNLLLLQDSKNPDIYILKSNLYDIEFEFNNNEIYCLINLIQYKVLFNTDENTYFNYGIFKLENINNTEEIKILCFYNIENLFYYNHFNINNKKYINLKNNSIEYFDIELKNLEPYYVIINMFENTLILKNENDVMALLINCLMYNNPKLILKSIVQIKTILFNCETKKIKDLLRFIFLKSENIYSLFIRTVLFNNYELNEYNYHFYDIILKKYNYNFELFKNNIESFNYFISFNITNNIENIDNNENKNKINSDLFKLFNFTISETSFKNNFTIPGYVNIRYRDNNNNDVIYIDYMNSRICNYAISIEKDNFIRSGSPDELSIKKYNTPSKKTFKNLLKKNILNFDETLFNKNITVAEKLFIYLTSNSYYKLYPIQELIMGSGKSSVITPFTIILLYEYIIDIREYSSLIYVVVPDFLLNQTFETMMSNVQPICFEMEIILFKPSYNREHLSIKKNYKNSISLIIISDTDLKNLFLTNKNFDISKSYFIYDEVDTIANPLTNELNIPIYNTKTELSNIDIIYDMTKMIYSFFTYDVFWNNSVIEKFAINNNAHRYLIGINENILKIIHAELHNYYKDTLMKNYSGNTKKLNDADKYLNYFKKNIITYIFTKQFNYDYGLPLNYDLYNLDVSEEYKYKAIPYLGGDSPLYGSSFSDPILSYVLTYFSYKLLYPQIRVIDIENILNIDPVSFNNLKNIFFNDPPESINNFKNFKSYYLSDLKNYYNLGNAYFEFYIKSSLNKNISFYEKCNNISFTDLLLKKNVKSYVGFTGTAYIQLPKEQGIEYENDIQITRSENKSGQNVEQIIESIILNNEIMLKYYKNKNSLLLIDNIFDCIKNYDVLIDIGAVFINVSNDEFIKKYNDVIDKKKYLVYFNNGIKVYNTNTNKYENENSLNKENKNTFFYFSNKNITGVDAKKFMHETAKALVTISINTNLRDFSQGIFRMRNIQDKQTFDLLIDYKMIDIYKRNKKEIQIGGNCFEEISDETRESIFELLGTNQKLIDKSKEKILLKQNILGLLKENTTDGECSLYIDPNDLEYHGEDINDLNLRNKIDQTYERILKTTSLTYRMFIGILYHNKYLKLDISQSSISTVVEKQTEKEKEKQVQINITTKLSYVNKKDINVNLDIINYNNLNNFIYFSKYQKINYSKIIILYNSSKNNLYIIPIAHIDIIFQYNDYPDFINNFTIISIHNDNVFGNNINHDYIKILKIFSKMLLEKHNNFSYLQTEEINFIKNDEKYKEFIKTFKEYYNFDKYLL